MLSIVPCGPLPAMVYKVGSLTPKGDYRFEWIVSDPFSNLWLMDCDLGSPPFSFANACFTVLLKKRRRPSSELSWITACVKNGTLHSLLRIQAKLGIVGKDGKDQDIQTGDMDGREFWVHNWMLSLLMKRKMVNHALTIFCELRTLDENVQTAPLPKTPQCKANPAEDSTKNFLYSISEGFKGSRSITSKDGPKKEKEIFSCSIGSLEPQRSKEVEWEPWIPISQRCTDKAGNWFCEKLETPKLQGEVKPPEDKDSFSCLEKVEYPISESKVKPEKDDDFFSCLEKMEYPILKKQVLPTDEKDPLGLIWTEDDLEVFRPKSQVQPKKDDDLIRFFRGEEDFEVFRPRSQVEPKKDDDLMRLFRSEEDFEVFRPRSQVQPKKDDDLIRFFRSEEDFEVFRPRNAGQTKNEAEDKDVGPCSVEKVETSRSKGVDKVLQGLKGLLASEEQSDVILKMKGKCFKAHKLIISMRSPVFHSMFQHDMVEKETGEVNIDDCDPETFPDFLSYLYTGRVDNLSADNVFSL